VLTALLERVAVLADQLEKADHEEELLGFGFGFGFGLGLGLGVGRNTARLKVRAAGSHPPTLRKLPRPR